MAVLSGKAGTMSTAGSAEAAVGNWNLTITSANDAIATNDSAGWKIRRGGVKDCTGSWRMADKPSISEGDEVAFIGYTNQDIYTVPVIIDSIALDVDINDGTIIGFDVAFSCNGAVVPTTGSAA